MPEIILAEEIVVDGRRMPKGTKIQHDDVSPDTVYNFYLNGVRTENRGGHLTKIYAAINRANKLKKLLRKR